MKFTRMPIERESPEEFGYGKIDNNLSESSIRDLSLADLGIALSDLTLFYGSHRGEGRLRELIAQPSGVSPDEVLVTAGAAGALFIVATSLLEQGDHVVVVRPNYATNIATPQAIGCDISFVDVAFTSGFRLDIDAFAAAIRPNTKLLSVTCPHNPTGTVLPEADLRRLVVLAERHGCRLLVDETYRDMTYGTTLPCAASLSPCAISVSSLSKSYGVPGIRVGWVITRDPGLYENFLAAKEQMGICGSVIDEAIAAQVLERREERLAETRVRIAQRLVIMREWVAREPLVDWVEPAGGVVCLPRLTGLTGRDMQRFHQRLLADYGTYVGPGHWFDMPAQFVRVGFDWPTETQLRRGLAGISGAMAAELAAS